MNSPSSLPVVFEDENFIVINKPANLLVHRTEISTDTISVVQILKEQLQLSRVHPVHRLDRATSGVLLVAKNKESAAFASEQFTSHQAEKTYFTIVRGWPANDSGAMESPLKNEHGTLQDSHTFFQVVHKVELPVQVSKFPTSRYSLLCCRPQTGRRHQIRRHVRHICGHVIGDTTYGKSEHNNYFRNKLNSNSLLLYSAQLKLALYPGQNHCFKVKPPKAFTSLFQQFNWPQEAIIQYY